MSPVTCYCRHICHVREIRSRPQTAPESEKVVTSLATYGTVYCLILIMLNIDKELIEDAYLVAGGDLSFTKRGWSLLPEFAGTKHCKTDDLRQLISIDK